MQKANNENESVIIHHVRVNDGDNTINYRRPNEINNSRQHR